jgi:hypothetical protein
MEIEAQTKSVTPKIYEKYFTPKQMELYINAP